MEKEPIYKVCFLNKIGLIKEIVVFSNESEEQRTESPFSKEEQEFIEKNNIPNRLSQQQIHKDDSISIIKNKILKSIDFAVSYHELYLFSNIRKVHKNLQNIFENISGKSEYVDADKFKQLLINLGISSNVLETISEKEKYTVDDLLSFESAILDESTYYKISIGKQFRTSHNELFSANPYDLLEGTQIVQASTNPLESFENQLLLNNHGGIFIDNLLYVCFAEDVLEYADNNSLKDDIICSFYFPLLVRNDILDIETLLQKRGELIKESKKMASTNVFHRYDSIDVLYDIYHSRLSELPYSMRGVDVFSLTMHPEFKHILPLDIIFKNVHATQSIPFIKYNPGSRRENIYRFYSETITKYGTKIPFLPAKTILKLAKETGRNKQISFSVENAKGDFYINIQNNGDIHISGNNFREHLDITALNKAIKDIANPVILHMNDFLKKNGYEIQLFQDIQDSNIEVEYIHYVFGIKIEKEINLMKYKNCFQSIFEMDKVDIHKGAEMRFKRVENYSEMNEEDIYIAGLFGHSKTREEIIGTLARKYDIGIQPAALRIAQFLRDHEQQQGRFVKSSVKIADSPGFAVTMQIKSYDDMFICELELDNSVTNIAMEYIHTFSIYLDALLRITQYPKSMGISLSKVNKICTKSYVKDSEISTFDNVVTGIAAVDVGMMVLDAYEEEDDMKEIGEVEETGAFGDLDDYETVDIQEDLSDIEEYEEAPEFEDISSIEPPSSTEEKSKSEDSASENNSTNPMYATEEQSKSQTSASESNSSNPMYAAEEPTSDSNNSSNPMYAAEPEEEQKSKESGGGPKKKSDLLELDEGSRSIHKNIDGMLLKNNNNNIFLSKMKKREPTLFLSEDDGRFSSYSKLCQTSRLRQPIILTPEEKQRIDEEDEINGTKSYSHSLEYGTDPDNTNHYICPRYWCLKTNSPISEKDAEEGKKCGKILGKGDKAVKPGHYIIEFNHPIQHHNPDGSYRENVPGFLEKKLHPKGLCMPCCFKKSWDSEEQSKRRMECNKMDTTDQSDVSVVAPKRTAKQESYIYEIRRYPIPQKRWGFLPISVQFFLQTDNGSSINPDNNKYLREDRSTNTLLRYGVENSAKKSFIACIADIYAYKTSSADVPTIDQMCDIIANAISIDLFLKYHNGSLASIFRPKTYDMETIDPTKYESAEFMQRLDQGNETHLEFIHDTIAAYENFIQFLKTKDSYIDHTYLWDIVCSPNPALFSTGCNLAILRIKEVDMTDDIELLCPTSVYSSILYDVRKETVVLIKHDEYYEPIYLFKNKVGEQKNLTIQKTLLEDISIANIKEVLQIIRVSIQTSCLPKSSLPPNSNMPKQYTFARAMPAEQIRIILLKYKFVINAQVLNYQGKVIGFWLKYKTGGVYLPCFPSSQIPELPVMFMDDDKLWMNYKDTIELLNKVYVKSKGEILSRPVFKIIEDELVVGVLTETNQFVMISEPSVVEDDDIPVIRDENYIIADKAIAQNKMQDPLRVKTVQLISLETQFYGAFRTTVRILLNQAYNKVYKKQIVDMIDNQKQLYAGKLKYIQKILHTLCDKYIAFKEFDEATLMSLGEISDCFMNPAEKKFCAIQKKGEYKLIIPIRHLLSGLENNVLYFARMADELIRYKRINLYMMNSKMYLNITNTEYKINEDEMLMLESLLTSEYFKSLEPYEHGNTAITYETANPIITQKYSNEISYQRQRDMVQTDSTKSNLDDTLGIECIQSVRPITGKKSDGGWKVFFSDKSTESDLNKTVKCSYYPIIYVFYEIYGTFLTIEQIKTNLVAEYSKYSPYLDKILSILRKQGKRTMVDDIRAGKYTLETVISTDVYFLTNLDLWVLATAQKLPIILFHQKKLKNLIDSVNWLKLSDSKPDKKQMYYFIRVPTEPDLPNNYLPQYSIVKPAIKMTAPEIIRLFSSGSPNSTTTLSNYLEKINFKPAPTNVAESVEEASA